jgi:hypothetical protein
MPPKATVEKDSMPPKARVEKNTCTTEKQGDLPKNHSQGK